MISEEQYKRSAAKIGCEVAAIKAVTMVESNGAGFLKTGEPVILFEPHIFWKQLRLKGIDPAALVKADPSLGDILYPVWGTKKYGKPSEQHAKLARAVAIDRDAAMKSASWGLFQIMGFNYAACGCATLQDFINKIYSGEDSHLDLFDDYIVNSHLDDELKNLDWAGFARGYNGASYWKNKYNIKLQAAYNKLK